MRKAHTKCDCCERASADFRIAVYSGVSSEGNEPVDLMLQLGDICAKCITEKFPKFFEEFIEPRLDEVEKKAMKFIEGEKLEDEYDADPRHFHGENIE